ncbi:hypothetical protein PENTCL1PPCAC_9368, partial [Pristionchus entomophagus]
QMLQLLLYQLIPMLVPLALVHALCIGGGKQKRRQSTQRTGRSNMSTEHSDPRLPPTCHGPTVLGDTKWPSTRRAAVGCRWAT